MNLLFILTYSIWGVTEILLNRLLRSNNTDKHHADKNSLALIWITVIAVISIAVFIATHYPVYISTHAIVIYAGLALMYIGIILRLTAVITLGRFFTVDVTIRQDHTLKKDGLYRYLRHPSYLASVITFAGFGITLNNWIALVLIMAAIIIVFIIRIKIEEKILIERFGSEYIEYKKTTVGFIPFVY